jgi:hypothetical protein
LRNGPAEGHCWEKTFPDDEAKIVKVEVEDGTEPRHPGVEEAIAPADSG